MGASRGRCARGEKGGSPCRGSVVRYRRGSRVQGESPLQRAGVVLARSPACWAETVAFSQRVALRAGEGGRVMGNCVSPPAPPSIPPDHPFLWLSGRPLLAWFGRLLGKADTHHSCSQRPLRRDDLRATPRAPMGSAKPHGLREKSFEPPERWEKEGAAAGGSILEVLPY